MSIALLCAISTSTTTIAEEALPLVQPKRAAAESPATVAAAVLPEAVTDDLLPAEPLRDYERTPMSMAEAARANDYAAFDAAYRRTNDAAYAELHALWTFSVSDPIGGFYGDAMHDRLARAYPRYAAYIEDFRIIDSNGNVFYPSAETRAFLTEQAIAGVLPVTGKAQLAVASGRLSAPKRESVAAAPKVALAPIVVETTPAPVPAKPVVASAQPAAPTTANRQPTTAPTPVAKTSSTSRGLLLIIIGLLGIGALTMMLRTPAEELPPVDIQPFKKAGAEPPAAPRATGSHG